jgi:hypothetical protein
MDKPEKSDQFELERDKLLAILRGLRGSMDGISGKVGNVVFKNYNGKVIACRAPKMRSRPITAAQAAQVERFRHAVAEAKRMLEDPVHRTYYETVAWRKHMRPYAFLVGQLLRGEVPPDIPAALEQLRRSEEVRRADRAERARVKRETARSQELTEVTEGTGCGRQCNVARPQFTPLPPVKAARPLTLDEILIHVQRLTPGELRFLRLKLDGLLNGRANADANEEWNI